MFLSDNAVLKTTVGSCIALCIWDRTLKIGSMAHIMLPEPTNRKATLKTNYPAKYANLAVLNMFEELSGKGSKRKDLKAYLIGGASLFPRSVKRKDMPIGKMNFLAVKKHLKQLRLGKLFHFQKFHQYHQE